MARPSSRSTSTTPAFIGVADGLGGHDSGAIASKTVLQRIALSISDTDTEDSLLAVLHAANQHLYKKIAERSAKRPMGCSAAGIVFAKEIAILFNVGDCRVYLGERGGSFEQLSIDHRSGNRTDRVYQCFGGTSEYEALDPHIQTLHLKGNELFALCTDGVSDSLDLKNDIAPIESIKSGTNRVVDLILSDNEPNDDFTVALVRGGCTNS